MGRSNRRFIQRAPVVILRGPRSDDVFSYRDAEWVKVAVEHPSCNANKLREDFEKAGQQYRINRRDPSQSRLALRQALINDALQAWAGATGDTALRVSRTHNLYVEHGPPDGPLIRYLEAALGPILGKDMIGREALIKAIRKARR
jgi:hypothetical protein